MDVPGGGPVGSVPGSPSGSALRRRPPPQSPSTLAEFKHGVPRPPPEAPPSPRSPPRRPLGRLPKAPVGRPRSDMKFTKAPFPRASRAARASDPCQATRVRAHEIVHANFRVIRNRGLESAPKEPQAFRSHRVNSGGGGKGPGVRTNAASQTKMNHICSLKAKDLDTNNSEPAFLLGGYSAPLLWRRLAEQAIRANAVNSSVTNREKTQGAAKQTTRITYSGIGQAASAQVVACALAMAEARRRLRAEGVAVVSALATNAVNPCALARCDLAGVDDATYFAVASTSRLVYNCSPVKLTRVSVLSCCSDLARGEMDACVISNAMGARSAMLTDICQSVLGEKQLDPVWCAWVLVVYLCGHPRGRDLLRAAGLTDLDVQSAVAFERYGGEETRQRSRQRRAATLAAAAASATEAVDPGFGADADADADTSSSSAALGSDADGEPPCKRRRTLRGAVAAGSSDSYCILEFWHRALQSPDVSVLHTLAAHNKRTVRDAALCTLARQAEGTDVAENTLLQKVSSKNAVKSAQALVCFVGRRLEDVPAVLALRARPPDGQRRACCAFQRFDHEGASSALHACVLPPLEVRPPRATGVALAWSHAVRKLMPRSDSSAAVPAVLERMHAIRQLRDRARSAGSREARAAANMKRFVDEETDVAMTTHAAGTTRSFVSIRTHLPMNATHARASAALRDEALATLAAAEGEPAGASGLPALLGSSREVGRRCEPVCTPVAPLAVGICASEELRRWMGTKTRKGDPCLHHLGVTCATDMTRDVPCIVNTEPLPMLTVTDFQVECVAEPRSTGDSTSEVEADLALHVCGDSATRVVDVLRAMRRKLADSNVRYVAQTRAALFVAASQASYVGAVGSALLAGHANASISSSKKISVRPPATAPATPPANRRARAAQVADVNKLFLLTPFDCYVAGLNNVQRSFDGTFYSGVYGSRVDTGWTPPGLLAHNLRSDKRQHGNCCLSQEVANEMCIAFAKAHWVTFRNAGEARGDCNDDNARYFTAVPTATRGVPHGFVPHVHSCLNVYCGFLETARMVNDRVDADTVDSIACMPFGPFTQALRPDVEPTADSSLRTCVREEMQSSVATGRAFLVDATCEDRAIVKEPLFRRPCQVTAGDNPFANSYEEVDSFFNVASTLALLARVSAPEEASPAECVALMHRTVDHFVECEAKGDWPDGSPLMPASMAADALLLLNALYPPCNEVSELYFCEAFAKSVPATQQEMHRGMPALHTMRDVDLSDEERAEARAFWRKFTRTDPETSAWCNGLQQLLELLLQHDGSHLVDNARAAEFRAALERAVRSVWFVHSPDGRQPPPETSPLHGLSGPASVQRHHMDAVFVASVENDVKQRGALVGVKPHSLRQLLASMLGAFIKGVKCNVAVNCGGLSLRVSSDATVLDSSGKRRTAKAESPVQTEGDELAFGSHEDKVEGAVLQKSAFDTNALLCLPLYTAVEKPRNAELRGRGEFGRSQFLQQELAVLALDQQPKTQSCQEAEAAFERASDPAVSRRVNGVYG